MRILMIAALAAGARLASPVAAQSATGLEFVGCWTTPGTTGTPAFSIAARAPVLLPMTSIAEAGGPIHVRPAFVTASANAAFSERNP